MSEKPTTKEIAETINMLMEDMAEGAFIAVYGKEPSKKQIKTLIQKANSDSNIGQARSVYERLFSE